MAYDQLAGDADRAERLRSASARHWANLASFGSRTRGGREEWLRGREMLIGRIQALRGQAVAHGRTGGEGAGALLRQTNAWLDEAMGKLMGLLPPITSAFPPANGRAPGGPNSRPLASKRVQRESESLQEALNSLDAMAAPPKRPDDKGKSAKQPNDVMMPGWNWYVGGGKQVEDDDPPSTKRLPWWHGRKDVNEAEDPSATSQTAQRLLEALDEAAAASVTPGESVAAFAERLGRVWSERRGGDTSSAAIRDWLLQDHSDTLTGALRRDESMRRGTAKARGRAYKPRTASDLAAYSAAITRAWMTSRQQCMLFQLDEKNRRIAALRGFVPPAVRGSVAPDPLIDGSNEEPVASLTSRFVRELKRRVPAVTFDTYPRHGLGGFEYKGLSIDMRLGRVEADGFYPKAEAIALLRAVDAAARVVGAEWRAIYNDFAVASAVNTALGKRHVIYVGNPSKKDGRVSGLLWHGPYPLILHFHLDLVPSASAPAGKSQSELAW